MMLALGRWGQEDKEFENSLSKFKASLVYISNDKEAVRGCGGVGRVDLNWAWWFTL